MLSLLFMLPANGGRKGIKMKVEIKNLCILAGGFFFYLLILFIIPSLSFSTLIWCETTLDDSYVVSHEKIIDNINYDAKIGDTNIICYSKHLGGENYIVFIKCIAHEKYKKIKLKSIRVVSMDGDVYYEDNCDELIGFYEEEEKGYFAYSLGKDLSIIELNEKYVWDGFKFRLLIELELLDEIPIEETIPYIVKIKKYYNLIRF